ncbi:MAG: alpha/beta hydrolase [Candidatus Zixiibacteriota bacterium]
MRKACTITLLAVLSISLTLLLSCEQANNHKDSEMVALVDSVSSADGVNIVYEVNGPKNSDLTLVFIHCWSCDRSYWRNQAPVFSRTYKVVTIDLAGHGQSALGRGEYSMVAYGTDVATVVNKLGLTNVVLIGHSMGGSVITTAAKQLPGKVVALVGVDTFDRFGIPIPAGNIEGYIGALRTQFSETTKAFVGSIIGPKADSSLRQWIIEDMSGGDPTVGAESMLGIINYAYSDQVINDLKEVNLPLYLINSPSNTAQLDNVRGAVPKLEVIVQDSALHFGHMTLVDEFNKDLQEVLDDIKSGQESH